MNHKQLAKYRKKKIINALHLHPGLTQQEIAERYDIPRNAVSTNLRSLEVDYEGKFDVIRIPYTNDKGKRVYGVFLNKPKDKIIDAIEKQISMLHNFHKEKNMQNCEECIFINTDYLICMSCVENSFVLVKKELPSVVDSTLECLSCGFIYDMGNYIMWDEHNKRLKAMTPITNEDYMIISKDWKDCDRCDFNGTMPKKHLFKKEDGVAITFCKRCEKKLEFKVIK